MDTPRYSLSKGLKKGLIGALLFGLPMLMQWLPSEWMNLSVGTVLVMIVNFAKVKYIK